MSNMLASVVFSHRSGLVEDQVVNNFAFITAGTPATSGELSDISTVLESFYNDVHGAMTNSLATYLAPSISRSELPQIRHFQLDGHLDGTAHGSPVRTDVLTSLDATGLSTGLPAEVACCLSFHASYGGDPEFSGTSRPRARDRGRIYFGPLISSLANTDGTTGRVKPAASLIGDLVLAGQFLRDDADTRWCVWSRAAARLVDVTTVWVDDAWDTQRRRGEKATLKTTG